MHMKNERTVAVIIPSYNYAKFLTEAIESVLSQSVLPNEILISDDCSNDHSFAIGYEYQQKYPDLIKVNRNNQNMGIVSHFNKAISLTKADYICFLGADNIFPPNYIEETKKILDNENNVAIAYSDFELFGNRREIVFTSFNPNWQKRESGDRLMIDFPEFTEESRKLLAIKVNFIHGSSMFRRKAYEDVNGYEEISNLPEDYHLFTRIINRGNEARKAKSTFLYYRQHSEDQQNIKLSLSIQLKNYEKLYNDSLTENELLKEELRRIQSFPLYKITRSISRIIKHSGKPQQTNTTS